MKNALLSTYSKNILVRLLTVNMKNCLTQESKNVRPLQVTLLKMRPHYIQSSGTSPLAYYKKVALPPPPPPSPRGKSRNFTWQRIPVLYTLLIPHAKKSFIQN